MTRRRGEVSPEILDRSLTDIQAGRSEVRAVSARFPEVGESLGGLLQTAERAQRELVSIGPDRAFVEASRARIVNRVRALRRGNSRHRRPGRLSWRPAYTLATALLVGLLVGGAGVVQASAEALPGESLYGVKRTVEETRLAVAWSPSGEAALMERFAEERLSEAVTMAAAGQSDSLVLALDGYDDLISRLAALAETSGLEEGPGSPAQVQSNLERHIEILRGVRAVAPDNAQGSIDKAIERSQHNRAVIEQRATGESPSDLAPGRQRTPGRASGRPDGDPGQEVEGTGGPKEKTRTPGPPPRAHPNSTKEK